MTTVSALFILYVEKKFFLEMVSSYVREQLADKCFLFALSKIVLKENMFFDFSANRSISSILQPNDYKNIKGEWYH